MSNHPPMTDWPWARVEALEGRVAAMDDIVRQLAHDAGLYYVATDEDIAALEGADGRAPCGHNGDAPCTAGQKDPDPSAPTHDCVETGDCRCVAVEMVAAELDAESCICPDCTDGCAGCEKLREALQGFVDELVVDEPNCSCHLSPPCTDCVENGHIRELLETARAALKTDVPAETEMCPDCSWISWIGAGCSTCNGSGTVPVSGGGE